MNERPSLRIPLPTDVPGDPRDPRNTRNPPSNTHETPASTRQTASAPDSQGHNIYDDITVDYGMPVGTLVYTT
jgi:hypothetical protein